MLFFFLQSSGTIFLRVTARELFGTRGDDGGVFANIAAVRVVEANMGVALCLSLSSRNVVGLCYVNFSAKRLDEREKIHLKMSNYCLKCTM